MANVTMTPDTDETQLLVGRTFSDELRIILIVIGIIMLASGILGNGLLLLVMWRRRKVRDFPNVFIANLALADLIVVCCGLPFYLGDLMVGSYPVVNVLHCRVNAAILCVGYSVSITSLITISFNRYIKVCHTLYFHRIFSARRNVAICGALWGLGTIANTPALVPSVDFYGYDRGSHLCNAAGGEEKLQYGSVAMISFLVVPVGLIGYFNFAIYKFWRGSRKKMKKNWTQSNPSSAVGPKNAVKFEADTSIVTSDTGDSSGLNTDLTTAGGTDSGDSVERKRDAGELVDEESSGKPGLKTATSPGPETTRAPDAAAASTTKTAAVLSNDEKESGSETRSGVALAGIKNQDEKRARMTDSSISSRRRSHSLPIIGAEEELEIIAAPPSKGVSSASLIPSDTSASGSKAKASQQFPKGRKGSVQLSRKALLQGSLLPSVFEIGFTAAGSNRNLLTKDASSLDVSTAADTEKSSKPSKTDRSPRDKAKAGKKKAKTKAEKALVRSMLVISVSLFILYAPFAINLILTIIDEDIVPAELPATATLLLFVNCAINWIIYGLMNTVFREAYVSAFKALLCRRRSARLNN